MIEVLNGNGLVYESLTGVRIGLSDTRTGRDHLGPFGPGTSVGTHRATAWRIIVPA